MAAQKVLHELEAVKMHIRWPIRSIRTFPMMGGKVNVHYQGDGLMHRDQILSETDEGEVRACLRIVFPEHAERRSDATVSIYKNGQYSEDAENLDEARKIIAVRISSEEEIFSVKDKSGIIARFVANEDGSLQQLD